MSSFALIGIIDAMSAGILSRLTFACVVLALLTTAILSQTPKALNDFDQRVYLSIAYDLDRHGVFSNGFLTIPTAPLRCQCPA